jgi:Fe-S cluster biogenesis protein NfuA
MAVLDTVETTVRSRVEAALDEVRPAIARDGGDVWLIRVDDGTAFVQMVGACGGCSMVETTLKGAIERVVLERCPDVTAVVAV